jgi:hypothetical protein
LQTLANSKGWLIGAPTMAQDHPYYEPGLWFDTFMQGVVANGYRVDFIPTHYFGLYSTSLPGLGSASIAGSNTQHYEYLCRVYDKYQLPLWCETSYITPASFTDAQSGDMFSAAVDMQRKLGFVRRSSIFALGPNPYSQPIDGTGGLYDSSGAITALGTRFKTLL